ncbi:LysE family translocator [Aeromonas cavernicola]|uniref:Lysine transporter LysE n=1 Tax=Aeromonas cavernicola TaxID=1006623 RepID=A0A2H9U3L5_9GAMM|nr:LysE family translocator [Aeromonas cavernicola]PJG58604.1 lysine transporter LysE [Aeromonas cavernicola]
MFGIHDLPLFIVSGFLLNAIPGPDNLLIMLRSGTQGWRAGSAAALGIGSGTLIHVLAAALGLSALLSASAELFMLVKLAGALYLIYLGGSLLRQHVSQHSPSPPTLPALSYRRIYWQGVLTNVLNPKVALFFLAFMPQFIAPDAPDKTFAFILLGCLFNLNSMIWCHLLVFTTVYARRNIALPVRAGRWLNRGIGMLFVGLGLRLAVSNQG